MNTNIATMPKRSFWPGKLITAVGVIGMLAQAISTHAADAENRGQLAAGDYKFAVAAATGGALEVNLGKLAQEKSANPSIKQFGQHMVDQHGKAGTDLSAIAARKGAMLPSSPTASQDKEVEKLNKLAGLDFDKAYMALMVKDHKADLKEFKSASEKVQDSDLKAFAASTVPMIEEHLKMAQGVEDGLKGKQVSANK